MTCEVEALFVSRANDRDTGQLWIPEKKCDQTCRGLSEFQLGQWLIYDFAKQQIIKAIPPGQEPYETKLYEVGNQQRDVLVQVKTPIIFFSDKTFNKLLACSTKFGRIGAFFKQENVVMDQLNYAWIAYMAHYRRDMVLRNLMKALKVNWVVCSTEDGGLNEEQILSIQPIATASSEPTKNPTLNVCETSPADQTIEPPKIEQILQVEKPKTPLTVSFGQNKRSRGGVPKPVLPTNNITSTGNTNSNVCESSATQTIEEPPKIEQQIVEQPKTTLTGGFGQGARGGRGGATLKSFQAPKPDLLPTNNVDESPAAQTIEPPKIEQILQVEQPKTPLTGGFGQNLRSRGGVPKPVLPANITTTTNTTSIVCESSPSAKITDEPPKMQNEQIEMTGGFGQNARSGRGGASSSSNFRAPKTVLPTNNITNTGNTNSNVCESSATQTIEEPPKIEQQIVEQPKTTLTGGFGQGARGGRGGATLKSFQAPKPDLLPTNNVDESPAAQTIEPPKIEQQQMEVERPKTPLTGGFGRGRGRTTATFNFANNRAQKPIISTSNSISNVNEGSSTQMNEPPKMQHQQIGSSGVFGGFGGQNARGGRGGRGGATTFAFSKHRGASKPASSSTAQRNLSNSSLSLDNEPAIPRAINTTPPKESNFTFHDRPASNCGRFEFPRPSKENISGVVVSQNGNGSFFIYTPAYPKQELILPKERAGNIKHCSWIRFDAIEHPDGRVTIGRYRIEVGPAFETIPVRNTVQIKLKAFVPRSWKPKTSSFVPIVNTEFVEKVIDSRKLLSERFAGQAVTVVIERGMVKDWPDFKWFIAKLEL